MCFIVFINQIDCERLVNKHCWCKSVFNWWQLSLASISTITTPAVKTSTVHTMHMTRDKNVTVYRREGLDAPRWAESHVNASNSDEIDNDYL